MEEREGTPMPEATKQEKENTQTQPVTFTAEQMAEANRIADERAQRATNSALKAYFQQQGMTEEEAGKALAAYRAQKAAEKTPEQIAAEAKQTADNRVNAAKRTLIQIAAKAAAAKLGVKEERIPYMLKLADLSEVEVADDMTMDQQAVTSALQSVLEHVPELAGAPAPVTPAANPASNNQTTREIDAIRAAAGLPVK